MAQVHGICVPQAMGVDKVWLGPTTYVVSFPRLLQTVKCLVPRCPAVVRSVGRIQEHFVYRHFWYKVVMVQ